jgi:hypothetical protein
MRKLSLGRFLEISMQAEIQLKGKVHFYRIKFYQYFQLIKICRTFMIHFLRTTIF